MSTAYSSSLATIYQGHMPAAQYTMGSGNACLSGNAYMSGNCSSDADAVKSSGAMTGQRATTFDGECPNKQGLYTGKRCCIWLLDFICNTQALATQRYQSK